MVESAGNFLFKFNKLCFVRSDESAGMPVPAFIILCKFNKLRFVCLDESAGTPMSAFIIFCSNLTNCMLLAYRNQQVCQSQCSSLTVQIQQIVFCSVSQVSRHASASVHHFWFKFSKLRFVRLERSAGMPVSACIIFCSNLTNCVLFA